MPIRPSERERYPADWRAISLRIKERAAWRCESTPAGMPCRAKHGEPHPITKAIVVLTVAHLDHQPENCTDDNLRALCQRCHNRYDVKHRSKHRAETRRAQKQTGELFSRGAEGTQLVPVPPVHKPGCGVGWDGRCDCGAA